MSDEPTNSFNAESYNSWRYGDEASLYSIAEDSREDRQSEALSRAGMSDRAATLSTISGDRGHGGGGGGVSSGAFQLTGIKPWRSDNDDDSDDSPVEVKWVTDEEMDAALSEMPPILSSGQDFDRRYIDTSAAAAAARANNSSRRGGGAAMAPSARGGGASSLKTGSLLIRQTSSSSSEDSYSHTLGYRLNARPYRLVIVACLFCVAVVSTVLAVVLTAADNESTRPDDGSGGGNNINNDRDPEDIVDTLAPAPSPLLTMTSQPTANYSEIIAEAAQEFALESISACPYADASEFFDITVPQAEVFRELIIELKEAAKVQSDATDGNLSVDFESTLGMGYLLERWALLMLFFSTNGEFWDRNDGWYTDTDVCEWETSLRICEPRVPGEAAMTYLDLRK
jgi:hypothetical protein